MSQLSIRALLNQIKVSEFAPNAYALLHTCLRFDLPPQTDGISWMNLFSGRTFYAIREYLLHGDAAYPSISEHTIRENFLLLDQLAREITTKSTGPGVFGVSTRNYMPGGMYPLPHIPGQSKSAPHITAMSQSYLGTIIRDLTINHGVTYSVYSPLQNKFVRNTQNHGTNYFFKTCGLPFAATLLPYENKPYETPLGLKNFLPHCEINLPLEKLATFLEQIHSYDPEKFIVPPDKDIQAKVLGIPAHFSNSLSTPVAFTNPQWLRDILTEDVLMRPITLIKIQKVKNLFSIVQKTVGEYLENPGSYIANLSIPKIANIYSNKVDVVISGWSYQPTLILPPKLLTPSSENVTRTTHLLLDALLQKSFEPLLAGSAYEALAEKYPAITKYWDGGIRLAGGLNSGLKLDRIIDYFEQHDKLAGLPTETLKESTMMLSELSSNPKFFHLGNKHLEFLELVKSRDRLYSSVSKLASDNTTIDRRKRQLENDLLAAQQQLDDVKKELDVVSSRYHSLEEKRLAFAAIELDPLAKELRDFDPVVKAEDFNKNSFFTEVTFLHRVSNQHLQLTSNWERTKTVLLSPDYDLVAVKLVIPEPVKIYVDSAEKPREECPVVVGGPYIVSIGLDSTGAPQAGHLFLATIGGIFGSKPIAEDIVELKAHPHSMPVKVTVGHTSDIQKFLIAPTKICWGDAETPLKKAFGAKHLETIRIIVNNWVSSAWSKDKWGAQWQWFPTPDKIKNLT